MNRNLRNLCLVLSASLAMLGTSASAASAGDFHSEMGTHTVVKGTQVGTDVFIVDAGTEKCNEITYAGIQSGATATTVKVVPTFTECTAFGFINAKFDTNGCYYEFSGDDNTMKIGCPEGQSIVKTAFNCWVSMGPQTLTGVTYANTGSGAGRDMDITLNILGIHYTQQAKSFPGCKTGTATNGQYSGSITLLGFATTGTQVGIWRE